MPSQYYYANPEMTDIHGPFSSKDLVVLAHSGVLRREYYVSKDQETWFPATNVNGLIFPPEEAESERTAVDVLADADDRCLPLWKRSLSRREKMKLPMTVTLNNGWNFLN